MLFDEVLDTLSPGPDGKPARVPCRAFIGSGLVGDPVVCETWRQAFALAAAAGNPLFCRVGETAKRCWPSGQAEAVR